MPSERLSAAAPSRPYVWDKISYHLYTRQAHPSASHRPVFQATASDPTAIGRHLPPSDHLRMTRRTLLFGAAVAAGMLHQTWRGLLTAQAQAQAGGHPQPIAQWPPAPCYQHLDGAKLVQVQVVFRYG